MARFGEIYCRKEWVPLEGIPMDCQSEVTQAWIIQNAASILQRLDCTCVNCDRPAKGVMLGSRGPGNLVREVRVFPVCSGDSSECCVPIRMMVDTYIGDKSRYMCMRCGRMCDGRRCGACHVEVYCSRECQMADWPRHKPTCEKRRMVS